VSPVTPVFDGHNDALLRLSKVEGDPVAVFRDGGPGHIDRPKASAGGMIGGFFAMFSPPTDMAMDWSVFDTPPYDVPLPAPMARDEAAKPIAAQLAIAQALEAAGLLRFMRSVDDIAPAFDGAADGPMATILHLEGAECIAHRAREETVGDASLRPSRPWGASPPATTGTRSSGEPLGMIA